MYLLSFEGFVHLILDLIVNVDIEFADVFLLFVDVVFVKGKLVSLIHFKMSEETQKYGLSRLKLFGVLLRRGRIVG